MVYIHVRKFYLESFLEEQIHLKRDKYVSKIYVSVLIISTSAPTESAKREITVSKGAIIIWISEKGNYSRHTGLKGLFILFRSFN